MTYEFEYLMHLFACGSRGWTPHPPRQPVDFDRLIQLAQEQYVLPLVGVAMSRIKNVEFPREKVQALVKSTRSLALTNYMKRGPILKLLGDFEEAGLQAVLLKGYALADLYAEPNCRISTDTDIYINKKDEKRACKLLKDHGCSVKPRSPTSHHGICEHPQMGHIELHVILYDEFIEGIWFGQTSDRQFINESFERIETEDGSYLSLGKTDNLIFLALHMIKHFILSGTSLRQIMDIALFFKNYQSQIDIKQFWDILKTLNYKKLVNTVLEAMVSYCVFSPEDFTGFEKQDEESVSALLSDLETGGWLGKSKIEERRGSWYAYNRFKYTEKRNLLSYLGYLVKRNAICFAHALIPSKAALVGKFPYASKNAWLIPAAWIHHMIFGIWRLLHGKYDFGIVIRNRQVSADDKSRDHLFRIMNMM